MTTDVLVCDDDTVLSILHMATTPLSSFSYVEGLVELIPLLNQSVFTFEIVQQLESIYKESSFPLTQFYMFLHFITVVIV